MDNSTLKTVELNKIFESACNAQYIDEYIIATNNISDIFDNNTELRFNFCIIMFCTDGCVKLTLNDNEYTLQKNDVLISLPYSIVGNIMMSSNNKIQMLGLSPDFIKFIGETEKSLDNILAYVHHNPVFHAHTDGSRKAPIYHFGNLIDSKLTDRKKYLRKNILRYMFSALFGEIMAEISEQADGLETTPTATSTDGGNALRVFKLFLKELSKDDGRHRSVGHYADLICYSPKYLSYVVKTVSGRTALSFINEHTMKLIKYKLLYSDKSIKEIAEEFNFPNLSFFGKYVKRNIGMSPIQFRNSKKDDAEAQPMTDYDESEEE